MNILRLELDINNAKRLPYTMLGMTDKLMSYQQNLVLKRNDLHQLKGKVFDEKNLNKCIAYVKEMLGFSLIMWITFQVKMQLLPKLRNCFSGNILIRFQLQKKEISEILLSKRIL